MTALETFNSMDKEALIDKFIYELPVLRARIGMTQDEISEMITSLSNLFRLSLTKDSSPFTELAHETEYVSSYLALQKIRYEDKLEYSITTST